MLRLDEKERICDLAWELGYDWDLDKADALFDDFVERNPDAEVFPAGVMVLYKLIREFEERTTCVES